MEFYEEVPAMREDRRITSGEERSKKSRYAPLSSYIPQILAVVTGTLTTISDGMSYGWTAPVIPKLQSPDTPVAITQTDIVWLEALLMVGGVAGLPITIYLVDKIGRKRTILFASCVSLGSWILTAAARRVELFYVARFFIGLAGDVGFVANPIYVAEIADQEIRGFLSGLIYLMMLVGLLIVYTVVPFVTVTASSLVGASILVLQLCTFSFMPESPYYSLMRNRVEEATKSLQWLRNTTDVEEELHSISEAVERQQKERGKLQDLVLVKSNRKGLIILAVLNMAQHFSSISVILMNLHLILAEAGSIYIDSRWAAIIFAACMFVAATIALTLVDRAGRRILLVTSSLLTGVSLAVLASYFAVKNSGVDVSTYSWLPIVSVMVYAIVFKVGLGVVPIILTGELFPTSVKAMGITIADAVYVIFALVSIYMYQELSQRYGIHVPFFVFSASCIFTAAFAAFFIPETKERTLEEIQMILKGIKPSRGRYTEEQIAPLIGHNNSVK